MSENTKIEWADHTINFWWGCTKVSPGCANCYAETLSQRFGDDIWGKGKPRRKIKGAVKEALRLNRKAAWEERDAEACGREVPRRPRVFCASMSDWLDPEVPIEWLAEMLDTIRKTPHLDWLLLTKRPELWLERLEQCFFSLDPDFDQFTDADALEGWEQTDEGRLRRWLVMWKHGVSIPHNVWIGTSVEDQKRADERIPALLKIPARVRFLSCEPLLGPVNLDFGAPKWRTHESYHSYIHWVICGGESGPKARPMHPDWARSLRDQCREAGVAFFMKQMGGVRKPFEPIPDDLMIREFPEVKR